MALRSTLRYVVYDVLEMLRQNNPDHDISLAHALYWTLIHADRLKKLHIQKRFTGTYMERFQVAVSVDTDYSGQNYSTLPKNVYDYEREDGIAYITYPADFDTDVPTLAGVQFTIVKANEVRRLYYRSEETPAPDNPYAYRQGDRVWYLGLEQLNITEVEMGLYVSFNPVDSTIDLDEDFDFPQDLIPQLKREILQMGIFVLNLPVGTDVMNSLKSREPEGEQNEQE